jgi:hypothetical protein
VENLHAENEVLFALFTALVLIGIAFIISWLFLAARSRSLLLPLEGVVAPFFGLPAVLFSLTAALFATSIWENYDAASRAVRSESQGIMSLISLANSIPALSSEGLSHDRFYLQQSLQRRHRDFQHTLSGRIPVTPLLRTGRTMGVAASGLHGLSVQ